MKLVEFNIKAAEQEAKKRLNKIIGELVAIRTEYKSYQAYIAELTEFLSSSGKFLMLRKNPLPYLPKSLQTSLAAIKTTKDPIVMAKVKLYVQSLQNKLDMVEKKLSRLEIEFNKAQDKYAIFSDELLPSTVDEVENETSASKDDTKHLEKNKQLKPLLDIDDLPTLTWIPWPKESKKISYGSSGLTTGPGELRLARVFGGKTQGSAVSYDVAFNSGDRVIKLEVKGLSSPSEAIRPGQDGAVALEKNNLLLTTVMQQIRSFIDVAYELSLDQTENSTMNNIIAYINKFLEIKHSKITDRGEFAQGDMFQLVKVINILRKLILARNKKEQEKDLKVSLNDKTVSVDKETFIDISRSLEKFNVNILKDVEKIDIALSQLRHDVFKSKLDARITFLEKYVSLMDVSTIFAHVNYLVVVNEELGFNLIPKDKMQEVLRFDQVSQGIPRFKFTRY